MPKLKTSNATFWDIFKHFFSTRNNPDSGNKHFEFKEKFIIKVSLDILMQKLHLPFSNSTEFPSRAFLQPEQNCINSLLHMYLYFVMHFQCPHGVGALPFGRQLVPHHPAKMQKSNHPSNSTGYVSLFNQNYDFYSLG